ncbi:MAG: hypothetical protein ATN31_07775 [Candidatus Epulonipiscioides saccharophilum]|nr:MAG: hypothetical protein ATN31_07775 [Epulopiscium sp. AS2M-Bin001]
MNNALKSNAKKFIVKIPDARLRNAITILNSDIQFNDLGEISLDTLKLLPENFEAIGKGIKRLDGLQHVKHLKYINLSNNFITDITALSSLPDLAVLILDDNQIKILDLFGFHSLSELSLKNNQIKSILFSEIRSAISHLIKLDLSNNLLGSNLTFIELLQLGYSTFDAELFIAISGPRAIDALAQASILKILDLSNNQFLTDISTIEYCEKLSELNLIGDFSLFEGLEAIGTLSNLEKLELESSLFNNFHIRKELIAVMILLSFSENSDITDTTILLDSDILDEEAKDAVRCEVLELLEASLAKDFNNGSINDLPQVIIDDSTVYEFDPFKESKFDYRLKMNNTVITQDIAELTLEITPTKTHGVPIISLESEEVIEAVDKLIQFSRFNESIAKLSIEIIVNEGNSGIELEIDADIWKGLVSDSNSVLEVRTQFVYLTFDYILLKDIWNQVNFENVILKIKIALDQLEYNRIVQLEIINSAQYFKEFENRIEIQYPDTLPKFRRS